jgi:hypothetical protein
MVLATEVTAPTTSPRMGDSQAQGDRQQDAERPANHGHPLDPQEIAQRELDADREHQQDDADLGEQLEGVDVRHRRARRQRAHQDAAQDVAQDHRLTRQPRDPAADDRGEEHVGEILEEARVSRHRQGPWPGHRPADGVRAPGPAWRGPGLSGRRSAG